jgi:2-amino-4-hydroxy-6-hydroxymethyldihydropteridine diphosphokinase
MIAQFSPIILAFGANLGDRETQIREGAAVLSAHDAIDEFKLSPLHESIALTTEGRDEQAPAYLNAVASAVTTLKPLELLDLVLDVEDRFGRTRQQKWGDRTLDIDIITYAGKVMRDERLTLPHPSAHERDFVLAPWLALDPGATLIRYGRVSELLAAVGDTTRPYRSQKTDVQETEKDHTAS